MTPIDLAKEIFPDGNEAFWDHAIWARTGFPSFWSLKEGQTVEEKMREQLTEFRDALAACPDDKRLCEHCNNHVSESAWHCISCDWNRCFELAEM